ncbi:MAG: thiamine pyrophosphate-dependent enzyme [Terracidiphilus sp.]
MTRTKEQSAAVLAGKPGFSIISNEKLLQLYAAMVKCRALEERLQILFPHSKLAGKRGSVSREAVAVGAALDMLPEDTIAASPGDLVVNFIWNEIQSEPLEKLFGRLCSRAIRPSPAVQFKRACSAAQVNRKAKNGKISVVFSSNGSGSSDEVLKAAGDRQLPILFVRQTRLPAEPPRSKQQTRAAEIDAAARGIPVIPVDGNDVVAVYRVSTEAITHARKGNGPTLIECIFEPSEIRDPLLKMEAYLTRKGLFSEEWKRQVAVAFKRELDNAIEAAVR